MGGAWPQRWLRTYGQGGAGPGDAGGGPAGALAYASAGELLLVVSVMALLVPSELPSVSLVQV